MARKCSSHSSDDDDDRPSRTRKESRSKSNGERDDVSGSSDSDRGNRISRYERWNGTRSDDKHRERERARVQDGEDRDGRGQDKRDSRGSHRSYDDGDEQLGRERSRREKERTRRHGNERRRRDSDENVRVKEPHSSSEEDDERAKRDRRGREKINQHENGHRRWETGDGYRNRDRSEVYKKSQRDKEEVRDHHEGGQSFREKSEGNDGLPEPPKAQESNKNTDAPNLGKSGGIYIPPFKLARMMKEVEDKSSVEYQRLTWDALRKSINGLVNKVNATNIKNIIPELFSENLIRGRGLFCRSCMKSQMASPGFTDVFAALVAVVNTKFPEVGDLLLRRIVLQLKRAYKRNDKVRLLPFSVIIIVILLGLIYLCLHIDLWLILFLNLQFLVVSLNY